MNNRLVWKYILIMLFVIIPVAVVIGIIFAPMTWYFSIPLALFFIPFVYITSVGVKLLVKKDQTQTKNKALGLLAAALLWAILFGGLLMFPSRIQFLFRLVVPGLAQADLEKEGKQIAEAVNGKFLQSFVSEGQSRIEVQAWRGYVTASVHNGSLSIAGTPVDSLPSTDSLTIIKSLVSRLAPFLNSHGQELMQAGSIRLKSRSRSRDSEWDIYVIDANTLAIKSFVTIHGLSFTISKGYSVLDESTQR